MNTILIEFDNKLKQSEIQVPLTRSSVDEAGESYQYNNTDKQQTLVYGIQTPLIQINNIVIDFTDVEEFELDLSGTLPRLKCTVFDRYNFIKILDTPDADNEIRVQILPQFDNIYKKINLTFQISRINIGSSISLTGVYKLPEFLSSQYKSFGKVDTYNLFKDVALSTGLGFATNCKNFNDERFVYCANQSYLDLLNEEIEISEADQTHIYNWWVDGWNNINLVNIYDIFNTILPDSELMIWVSGELNQMTEGAKITPQQVPAILNNNPMIGNTELFVNEYEINNKLGSYIGSGSDKVVTTYFEKTGAYTDTLIMDGDVKKNIYKNYEYGGEVYGDYNYILAKSSRDAYLQKLGLESLRVYLRSPMICLTRGMKVNFVWYTNDSHMDVEYDVLKEAGGINNVQTNPILDDTLDTTDPNYIPRPIKEFVKDESISGQYMIDGIVIRYKNHMWDCELILNRPSSQQPKMLTSQLSN